VSEQALSTSHHGSSRVLVIDPLEETREVLETMLARRGVQIVTAVRREEGLRIAREFQPDVVVFDCEAPSSGNSPWDHATSTEAEASFAAASPDHPPSLILIGSARHTANEQTACYVQKPYHYGPLVHTIETLLAERRAA
jgi:CheY-like chemotaxis protein